MRFFAILLLFATAHASAEEVFECRDFYDAQNNPRAPVLVVATINEDGKTGEIRVAGVVHKAEYSVAGLNRKWRFAEEYTLSVEPNGDALSATKFGSDLQKYRCTKAE